MSNAVAPVKGNDNKRQPALPRTTARAGHVPQTGNDPELPKLIGEEATPDTHQVLRS